MTLKRVQELVAEIRDVAHDNEAAHSKEDNLYKAVLEAIGSMTGDPPGLLARAALKSQRIKFERWTG